MSAARLPLAEGRLLLTELCLRKEGVRLSLTEECLGKTEAHLWKAEAHLWKAEAHLRTTEVHLRNVEACLRKEGADRMTAEAHLVAAAGRLDIMAA